VAGGSRFAFYANDFDSPVTSDWGAPTLATAQADTIRSALTVRRFDDTNEEGVGFQLRVPSNASSFIIDLMARSQSAPSTARVVGNTLLRREVPNATGPGANWTRHLLNNMTMPSGSTSYQQKPQQSIPLNGAGGFSQGVTPGALYWWELTRTLPTSPGGSNLVGDWDLLELIISFT
jgi:hypothetical protein